MEIQSASRTEKAVLGKGYNTKEEAFAGECVLGTTQYVGAQESNINFQRSLSATELADSLGFSISGRARFGLVSASMSANFASESSSSDYSEIMIYSARYKFKNAKLSYTRPTPVGERVKGSSADRGLRSNGTESTVKAETLQQQAFQKALFSLNETYHLNSGLSGTEIWNEIAGVSGSCFSAGSTGTPLNGTFCSDDTQTPVKIRSPVAFAV